MKKVIVKNAVSAERPVVVRPKAVPEKREEAPTPARPTPVANRAAAPPHRKPVAPPPAPKAETPKPAQPETPAIPKKIFEALPKILEQVKKHDKFIERVEAREKRQKLNETLTSAVEKFLKSKNVEPEKAAKVKSQAEAALRQKGYRFDLDGRSVAVVNENGKKLNLSIERIFDEALKTKYPDILPPPRTPRVATQVAPPNPPPPGPKPGSFADTLKKSVAKELNLQM